uniref:Uncharacterized protein n=1 Tax=Avena sativa TaxID=4498 RepID=A0ACD5ZCF0_AVESA
MALPIVKAATAMLARGSAALNALLARAVVFRVPMDARLVVEGLLITMIVFQLSRKGYRPPKKSLSKKEVDELCDEWEPEPLCPPIKEGARIDPPILESAAGPHTTIDGKEVVNFASANYLGLISNEKIAIDKIDTITAGMGNALATDGGFCTGSARVVDHQRLSSSGYVFSNALAPYLATAAVSAVNYLEKNSSVLINLRSNVALVHKGLSNTPGLEICSHLLSPMVFLKLKKSTGSLASDLELLETIAEQALKEDSVFIVASKRSCLDMCKLPVGIRLFVSAGHTESDISKVCSSLKRISALVLV